MMHRLKSEDRGDLRKIPDFDIWSLVRGTKMDVRNAEVLFFSLGRKYGTDFSLSLVSQFGFDLVSTDYGLEYYEKILASGESGDRAGAFSVTLYHDTSLGGDLSGRRTGWEACLNFRDSEKSSTGCTILFDDPGGQSILSLATALRHIESTWVKHSKDAWELFLETGESDFVMDRLGPIDENGALSAS